MDRVFRFFENYADENEHRRESNATRIKKVYVRHHSVRHHSAGFFLSRMHANVNVINFFRYICRGSYYLVSQFIIMTPLQTQNKPDKIYIRKCSFKKWQQ